MIYIYIKLKEDAKKYYPSILKDNNILNNYFLPGNVVLFPINKEIHNLIAHSSLVSFNIHALTDLRQSGNVGKKTSDIIRYKEPDFFCEKIVIDYDLLDWEEPFDTIIVGHIQTLEKLMRIVK